MVMFSRTAEVHGGGDGITASLHATTVGLFGASVAGVLGYLPVVITSLAGVAALIMYCITIWESRPVQAWVANRASARRTRKLAKLKAKQKILLAQIEAVEKLRVAKAEVRELMETAKSEAAVLVAKQDVETATRAIPPE
jgi:hypothetical protein